MGIECCEKECLPSANIEWSLKIKYFLSEIHENIHPGLTKRISDLIHSSSKISINGEYTVIKNISSDVL